MQQFGHGIKNDVIRWEIVNAGSVPFIVRGIYGTTTRGRWSLQVSEWNNEMTPGAVVVPAHQQGAPDFPAKIEVAHVFTTWTELTDVAPQSLAVLLDMNAFYALDQFGRRHWFPKRQVAQMKARVRALGHATADGLR